MGQEIALTQFDDGDFRRFHEKLEQETLLLKRVLEQRNCSKRPPVAGFEIEACLVDSMMRPAPINRHFLATLNDPLASPELAKFNIEFNSLPVVLQNRALSDTHRNLQATLDKALRHAENMASHIIMIGILPTLSQGDLCLANMSDTNRYRALNEQILQSRGQPIHIDIKGAEHLKFDHHDVMLEAATTSFQIHIQLPLDIAHHFYNASIIASAPMVAIAGNAPYFLGKELWHESRIPVFEQAIETGGYQAVAHGPLKRVSFGSGYARHSIFECFQENFERFPVLLPVIQPSAPEAFSHLRLHNGTIWRWNRPLIGFDEDGTPHIRVEHRSPAAGPTLTDSIANAAFYYGLTWNLCMDIIEQGLPLSFTQAKDNFYQAARFGLDTKIPWPADHKRHLPELFNNELLPRAACGLNALGIAAADSALYLDIIRQRIAHNQNGSQWQRRFIHNHHQQFTAMTRHYLNQQQRGNPVGEWEV